jgi:hypothetical protein
VLIFEILGLVSFDIKDRNCLKFSKIPAMLYYRGNGNATNPSDFGAVAIDEIHSS